MEFITAYILPLISGIVNKICSEFIVNKFFQKNKENTVINIGTLNIGTLNTVINHEENHK